MRPVADDQVHPTVMVKIKDCHAIHQWRRLFIREECEGREPPLTRVYENRRRGSPRQKNVHCAIIVKIRAQRGVVGPLARKSRFLAYVREGPIAIVPPQLVPYALARCITGEQKTVE